MADESINVDQLRQGMLAATKVVNKFTNNVGATNEEYKLLLDSLKKLNVNFQEELQKTAAYLKSVVGAATGGGGSKVVRTKDSVLTALVAKLVKCVCKQEISKKNVMEEFHQFMKTDVKRQKKQNDKLADALKTNTKQLEAVSAKPTKGSKGGKNDQLESIVAIEKFELANKALSKFQSIADGTLNIMFGLDDKARSIAENFNILKMAKDEQQFNRELAQTLYNVAGITGELKGVQDAFRNIGQVVEETGMDRTSYQKMYLENLQAGIQNTQELQKVTKQTLGTERLLGLEAGNLTEHFRELNLSGQLTTVQTAAIGRGMVDVARNVGLTGKNFEKAVSAAQQFNKDLIKSATLTAATSKNVLEIIANAQKLGVEDSVGRLLKAATNTNELMSGASAETSSFLYQAAGAMGRIQDLQMGVIARSKGGLQDLATGMEKVLQRFGVDSLEAVENLPDAMKMKLNIQLKSTYGMELGEITRSIKAFKEAGKGTAERLAEINKKQQQNLSLEEKTALLEQERKIKTNAALGVLTALNEAAKGAKNMNDALAKFDTRKSEFVADVAALGGSLANTQEGLKFTYAEAAKQLNDRLVQLGKSPIPIDQASIEAALKDKDAQALLAERLEKGFQTLQTAEKDAADPMTQTSQTLLAYNDYFRNTYAGPLLSTMTKIMGFTGIMATAITALGIAFVTWSVLQGRSLQILGKGSFLGKAAGGAAGQAAGAAAGGAATSTAAAGVGAGAKAAGGGAANLIPKFGMQQLAPQLKSLGTMLIGATAAIAMIGVAIIAVAAVMAAVGKALKVDPLKLALDVTKIIVAAAIIATEVGIATILFDKAMKAYGFLLTKKKAQELAWAGLKLALLVPAVVALAAGTLVVAKLATFGITASDAFDTAANVTAILLAAATIMGAVVAGAFIMLKIAHFVSVLMKVAKPLAIAAAIGMVVLPIITLAIVGLSALMLKLCGWILGIAGLDLGTIIKTTLAINIMVWGFNLFVLGLFQATMLMIATGAALMAVTAGLPGWKLALIGAAGLVLAAIAFGAVMYLFNIALDKIAAADQSGEMEKKIEAVLKLLNGFNKIMLGLLPIFAVIIAIGIAAGVLVFMGPAAAAAAAIGAAVAGLMFFLLPLMMQHYIGVAQQLVEAGAVAAKSVNPKQLQAVEKNLFPMLETVSKLLLRLAPIFLAMIAVGAVAGILAALLPVAPLVAAAALLAALALPIIAGALILLGQALINITSSLTSEFNMTEKDVQVMVDKVWVMSHGTWQIALAIGALGGAAIFGVFVIESALAPLADFVILFTAAAIVTWALIKVFTILDSAFAGFSYQQFMELTFKVMAFAAAMTVLNLALIEFAALGAAGLLGGGAVLIIGLLSYAGFLAAAIQPLKKILESFYEIGLNVYIMSVMLPFDKVNKAFMQLSMFGRSLKAFLQNVTKAMPTTTITGLIKRMFTQQTLTEKVKGYLEQIKNVIDETKRAGIKRGELSGAVVLFELLATFSKEFATAMTNIQKATASLSPGFMEKVFGGADLQKVRAKVTQVMTFMTEIITDLAPYAESYNAGQYAKVNAYMAAMAGVMTNFGSSMENMNKAISKVAELDSGWFSSNLDLITKNIGDGPEKMSQFQVMIGQVLDAIKDVVAVMNEKFPDGAEFDQVCENMASLAPIIRSFSELFTIFGGEMQKLFENPTWFGFAGKTGPGRFFVDNAGTINQGITDIFGSMALILNTMKEKIGDTETGMEGAVKLRDIAKIFDVLNPAMSSLSKKINEFVDIIQNEATFLTSGGYVFSTPYNKAFDAFTWKMDIFNTLLETFGNTVATRFNNLPVDAFMAVGGNLEKVGNGLAGMKVGMAKLAEVNKMFNDGIFTSTMDFINDPNQMSRMTTGVEKFLGEASRMATSSATAAANIPSNLGEINTKIQALSDFMVPLGKTLEAFSSNLGPLTKKGWFSDSIVDQVAAQSTSVKNALDKTIELVKSILDGVALIPDAKTFADVNDKMKLMASLIESLAPMLENFAKAMQTLLSAHGTDKSLVGYVKELSTKYKAQNPINDIYNLVSEYIVKPLAGTNASLKPDDVAYAADIMSSMGVMMKGLAESMQVINFGLARLVGIGGGEGGQTEVAAAKAFLDAAGVDLGIILGSLKRLVFTVRQIGHPEDVAEGAVILQGVSKIFAALAGEGGQKGIIETLNSNMATFTTQIGSGRFKGFTKLQKAAWVLHDLGNAMAVLMPWVAYLVDNVVYWVSPQDAVAAGDILGGITKILGALAGTKDGEGLISLINTRIHAITKQTGTAEAPSDSLIKQASDQIKNLATALPVLMVGMSDLIDAAFTVGPASDVKFASEVLGELPIMLGNIDKLTGVMTSMGSDMTADLSGSAAGILGSFAQISGFVKTLNGGFLDALISDVTNAVNKLSKLDQAMLALVKAFASIGNSMQQIGMAGAAVSAAGGVEVTTTPVVGTVAGLTAPGGGNGTQVAMATQTAMNSNAEVVAQIQVSNGLLSQLAAAVGGQSGYLEAIVAGVSGSKAAGSVSNPNIGKALAGTEIGGNSSNPKAGVATNGGLGVPH